MFSRNFFILAFLLAGYLYSGNGEPRIVQFGARGLSANKKTDAHQITLNHPGNETTPDEENKNTVDHVTNGTKNETNSTKIQNSTTLGTTEKMNITAVTTERPVNSPFDLPSVSDVFQLPKLDLAGWGWDSEMARVAQVMIGMGLYLFAMFIKGVLISWGVGEIKRSVVDKISSASSGTDALFDVVQFAITQAAQKYIG